MLGISSACSALVTLHGSNKDLCMSSGARIVHVAQVVLICHACQLEEQGKQSPP